MCFKVTFKYGQLKPNSKLSNVKYDLKNIFHNAYISDWRSSSEVPQSSFSLNPSVGKGRIQCDRKSLSRSCPSLAPSFLPLRPK